MSSTRSFPCGAKIIIKTSILFQEIELFVEKIYAFCPLLNFLKLKFKMQRPLNGIEYFKKVSAINFDSSDIA